MARDRPSPYEIARPGEGQALALRLAARFFTVARGPVPRDRPCANSSARDRPSPYAHFYHAMLGEGQALALRRRVYSSHGNEIPSRSLAARADACSISPY